MTKEVEKLIFKHDHREEMKSRTVIVFDENEFCDSKRALHNRRKVLPEKNFQNDV